MDFKLILEELLLEISAEEIYKKYYSNIDYPIFYKIVTADPKTVVDDGKIEHMGKYSKMLLDLHKRKLLVLEDLPNAEEYLKYIYKHNVKFDTKQIRGIPDLFQLVKQYLVQSTGNLSDILKSLDSSEYRVELNGNEWLIFVPLTERASCYLGVQSEWCTTWGPLSLNPKFRDRENRFKYYNPRGPLYIIINKEDTSKKYQFFFPNKEFGNAENKPINGGEFLNSAKEVKKYFFPSFFESVSDEQLKKERSMMSVLSSEDQNIIMKLFLERIGSQNPLVAALLENDEEELKTLINDPNIKEISYDGDQIDVVLDEQSDDIDTVIRNIRYYEHEIESPYDHVYYDMEGRYEWDEDYSKDDFISILESYYKLNEKMIVNNTGIRDSKSFTNKFFKDFYEDQTIRDYFFEYLIESGEKGYIIACQSEKESITKYFDYWNRFYSGGEELRLNKNYFIEFLISEDIIQIVDMSEVISRYLDINNLNYEYEGIYDYNYDTPTYDDKPENVKFVSKVDDYFDRLFGLIGEDKKCVEATKKYNEIVWKVFKNTKEFENEEVKVQINSSHVDCIDYTIDMTFKNKKTGKLSRGKVKVDNILNYVTNYPLFENLINFKKLIK